MATEKKTPTARKKNIKTPGAATQQQPELDPAKVPPEPNTGEAPRTEDLSVTPPHTVATNYVQHKTPEFETGRVMGNHVLTEHGWVRKED